MAVNIDTVYQSVLALANKEQRGYITPQEFNLLANQAQRILFEQYFYDYDQSLRREGNETVVSEMVDIMEEKIVYFESQLNLNNYSDGTVVPAGYILPTEYIVSNTIGPSPYLTTTPHLYRIRSLRFGQGAQQKVAECVDATKYYNILSGSPAVWPSNEFPIFYRNGANVIEGGTVGTAATVTAVAGTAAALALGVESCQLTYVRVPIKAEWDYVVVNEKALYNAAGSKDFDLHPSERTNLVTKILELSGVVINKPGLASYATQDQASTVQKQNA